MSVRRYLTKVDEAEAVRVLTAQFQCRKHSTSNDVRMAVRAVASQGGAVSLSPNFSPLRWVLEFKRIHGFVQLGSFVLGAASVSQRIGFDSKVMTIFKLPKRQDALPLMSPLVAIKSSKVNPTTSAATSNDHNDVNGNSANGSSMAQIIHSNQNSSNISNGEDKKYSVGAGLSNLTRVVMYP